VIRPPTAAELTYRFFEGGDGEFDPLRKELALDAMLHGLAPTGSGGLARVGRAIGLAAAQAIAALALLWSCLRFGERPRRHHGKVWLAAHGEWSNRTRHLLQAAVAEEAIVVLVLGRPKKSKSAILRLWRQHLPNNRFALVRPVGFGDCWAALRKLAAQFRGSLAAIERVGHLPRFGRMVAIEYRLLLGEAHRHWWRRSANAPAAVIYGHTGTADTCPLEREQQKAGTRTAHLLHGFSAGIEFSGISDVTIAKCRHDAEWHERLGFYGRSIFFPADRPVLKEPTRRWALLTNYAHPMAAPAVEAGIQREKQALASVAAAAAGLGLDPAEVFYRPHPALLSLDRDSRSAVADTASASGLGRWPADLDLDRLGEFELVVVTPSTVIQDALLAGTVPVLLDLAGSDGDSVYADYPLKARTEAELAAVLREVQADREGAFERAWNAVGPGINPSLDQIEAAVGQLRVA
jgi:hypothetical protein